MAFSVFVSIINIVLGGGASDGLSQSGCNAVTASCYSAGGTTFGAVTAGAAMPAATAACSKAQGACMKLCIFAGFIPFLILIVLSKLRHGNTEYIDLNHSFALLEDSELKTF